MTEVQCNISEFLNKKGMTQRELADAVGTTEVSISRYVSGERIPKVTTCIQISKVLGCNVEDLYTLQSEEEHRRMTEELVIEYIENHGYISDEVKDIVIKALEKQIPKKPIVHRNQYDHYYTCPTCNSINIIGIFCNDCCQKIDWSDKE